MKPRFEFILAAFLLALPGAVSAQTAEPEAPPMLLGTCTRDSLELQPYVEWSQKNYDDYEPHGAIVRRLRESGVGDFSVTIFFGTWCGDSKREVPRFLKLLDALSFPAAQVSLIGVSNADSALKQSPAGEERGLEIYRVPTFIVSRDGAEVHRIVEYPVISLERDLLQIVSGGSYSPNYRSHATVSRWLEDGLLEDDNVSYRGLANQIRSLVASEGELSSVGYVLLGRGRTQAAVKVFQMNCVLYPESANRYLALARGLHQHGDDAYARRMVQKALELNDDPRRLEPMMQLLEQLQPETAENAPE